MSAPTLRAAMELDCTRISRGEDTKEAVVERCISKMKECFQTCVAVRAGCVRAFVPLLRLKLPWGTVGDAR